MKSDTERQRILNSPFDIQVHKDTFIDYLEVVIHPDGSIHYAVPSHQEYLINYLMDTLGKTRSEVSDMCPPKYWFDYATWLCMETKCVLVWSDYHLGYANTKQLHTLRRLKMNGLYKGTIKEGISL